MMKTEIIEKMEQFAERVLQGDDSVTPQETATLPEVLKDFEMPTGRRFNRN